MALAHVHTARRLHFSASSDDLLLWLSEECWGRGLIRLAGLLVGAAFSEGVALLDFSGPADLVAWLDVHKG